MSSDKDIKELTQTLIQTKILEAFKESDEYVDSLVRAVTNQEVDEHGGLPRGFNAGKERMPYLTFLVRQQIQLLVQEAVRNAVKEREEEVYQSVQAQLAQGALASGLVAAVTKAVERDWQLKVEVRAEEDKEDY